MLYRYIQPSLVARINKLAEAIPIPTIIFLLLSLSV